MLGLGRPTMASYPVHFCLYKIPMTRTENELNSYLGASSHIEQRRNCVSLDAHLKFSKPTATSLNLVCLFIFSDSFTIQKDELSERTVTPNYKL